MPSDRSRGSHRLGFAAAFAITFAVSGQHIREPDRSQAIAIGTIRAITSAESAYAAVNGGIFDRLECLAGPSSCVPAAGRENPFIDRLARTTEHGYRFEFFNGPLARSDADVPRSKSAMTRFAVVAVPLESQRGQRRAFCADDRQVIYITASGAAPRVADGRCLDATDPLR